MAFKMNKKPFKKGQPDLSTTKKVKDHFYGVDSDLIKKKPIPSSTKQNSGKIARNIGDEFNANIDRYISGKKVKDAYKTLSAFNKLDDKKKVKTTTKKKTFPESYTDKDKKFLKEQNEDIVRYEDLDKKGQKIWKSQGKPVPKKTKK
tara:strand:- start:1972 stop:2412 length:441 start_codon:yes stop_codon:yes gene_type:complete